MVYYFESEIGEALTLNNEWKEYKKGETATFKTSTEALDWLNQNVRNRMHEKLTLEITFEI
jgi:hypothetical protein